jgi:hypothetical protein
MGLEKQRETSA